MTGVAVSFGRLVRSAVGIVAGIFVLLALQAAPAAAQGVATTTTMTITPTSGTSEDVYTVTVNVVAADNSVMNLGNVFVAINGAPTLQNVVVNGTRQFTMTGIHPGTYSFVASYNDASGTYAASNTSPTVVNVTKAATTTTLSSSPNPSAAGAVVTFVATVTPVGGGNASQIGTISFFDGATQIGQVSVSFNSVAQGIFTTSALGQGTHSITARFEDNQDLTGSTSAPLTQTVTAPPPAATTTTVTSSLNPAKTGQNVTFTATVASTSTPTGTVTFSIDGTAQTPTQMANGAASFTTSSLAAGDHAVTATYSGDAGHVASTSAALTETVTLAPATTTTLSTSQASATFGKPVTFTAQVGSAAGAPTGTVTFKDGATTIGTGAVSGGTATFTTKTLAVGTHQITATYASADGSFAQSTSAVVVQTIVPVVLVNTQTTLTASSTAVDTNKPVTFTAQVTAASGIPTGTVTFMDGGSSLGTVTLNGSGSASLTTSSLSNGDHSITAVYSGDPAGFKASTSGSIGVSVRIPPDSLRLRAMQVLAAPVAAQASGDAISAAIGSAVNEGFADDGAPVSPTGSGFRFNFAADPERRATAAGADDPFSRRYGTFAAPGSSRPRGSDAKALGYADDDDGDWPSFRMPSWKTPEVQTFLPWAEVRGASLDRWNGQAPGLGGSADLSGNHLAVLGGLSVRLGDSFLVGALAGWENFDYRSDALQGRLKGDGWSVGPYLGWRITREIKLDAGLTYSAIGYDGSAGTAQGSFRGDRLLATAGVSGTYGLWGVMLEPSARVYGLWESEKGYTDSLGTVQDGRNFSTGRASAGLKVGYPVNFYAGWQGSVTPYVGAYADYYFNSDSASGLAGSVPLVMDGASMRLTGGVSAQIAGGGQATLGLERGGIGGDFGVWTYRARATVPFAAQ